MINNDTHAKWILLV